MLCSLSPALFSQQSRLTRQIGPNGTAAGGEPAVWLPPVNFSTASASFTSSSLAEESCVSKLGICYGGNDLPSSPQDATSAAQCCNLCAAHAPCNGWSGLCVGYVWVCCCHGPTVIVVASFVLCPPKAYKPQTRAHNFKLIFVASLRCSSCLGYYGGHL